MCTKAMSEKDMTPDEIDAEFERTAYIGDMVGVLAEAEDIAYSVDELPLEVLARLDRVLRNAVDRREGRGS